MLSSFQSGLRKPATLTPILFVLLGLAGLLFVPWPSQGQPAAPSAEPAWIRGPATVPLGEQAELAIPDGYRFAPAQEAIRLLKKASVPANLVGIMAPDAKRPGWYIVLESVPAGYVKLEANEPLDPATVLEEIRRVNQPQEGVRSRGPTIDWDLKPTINPSDHTLEWALRVTSSTVRGQPAGDINHSIRFLGRHAVVDATAVRSFRGTHPSMDNLRDTLKGFAFKPGERYQDYQAGDKVSTLSLAQLIARANSTTADEAGAVGPKPAFWIYLGAGLAAAGLLAALVVLMIKKRRQRHLASLRQPAPPIAAGGSPAPKAAVPVPAAPAFPAPQTAMPSSAAPAPRPVTALAKPASAALPRLTQRPMVAQVNPVAKTPRSLRTFTPRRTYRRHRAFDYSRYFADLMNTVSGYTLGTESSAADATGAEAEFSARTPPPSKPPAPAAPAATSPRSNAALAMTQAAVIEEQRRLIQEQARLIEEKNKLIAQQDQLLKHRSGVFEQKTLNPT